jgi:hypothetical protein
MRRTQISELTRLGGFLFIVAVLLVISSSVSRIQPAVAGFIKPN